MLRFLVTFVMLVACKPQGVSQLRSDDGTPDRNTLEGTRESIQFKEGEADPSYEIWQHGEDCAAAMGPVPPYTCAEGEVVPVSVDGRALDVGQVDRCDVPQLVDPITACIVGQRLVVKKTQFNGEDVYTVALCRRARQSAKDDAQGWQDRIGAFKLDPTGRSGDLFHNIAAIQYKPNKETGGGTACFFEIRHHRGDGVVDVYKRHAQKSPELAKFLDSLRKDGGPIPILPPTLPKEEPLRTAVKGVLQELYLNPAQFMGEDACVRCHDGDLWIRTPALKKLRNGADFLSSIKPDDPSQLQFIGKHHSTWMAPENRPYIFDIKPDLYLRKFHAQEYEQAKAAGKLEAMRSQVTNCHSCHAVGLSRLLLRDNQANMAAGKPIHRQGMCYKFARNWFIPREHELGDDKVPADRKKVFEGLPWNLNPDAEATIRNHMTARGALPESYFWMPQGAGNKLKGLPLDQQVATYYQRNGLALEAVRNCCDDVEMEVDGQKVCY